jgi:hypothetical protein
MAMETDEKPKRQNRRGCMAPTRIPKMVTHLVVARQLGVSPATVRQWATADPPLFLRPQSVIGQFLLFREADVCDLIDSGEWHHPSE